MVLAKSTPEMMDHDVRRDNTGSDYELMAWDAEGKTHRDRACSAPSCGPELEQCRAQHSKYA